MNKKGMTIAICTVIVLIVRYCVTEYAYKKNSFGLSILNPLIKYLITGITVLVVAVPEGLPLAVTISLAYAVKKMMKDNNLVRHLDACETMGNATAICSDKTGTLTTNRMTVVQCFINNKFWPQLPSPNDVPEMTRKLAHQCISINSNYASKIEPPTKQGQQPTQLGMSKYILFFVVVEIRVVDSEFRDLFLIVIIRSEMVFFCYCSIFQT
jgi:Ca2+ transporting ATPase